MRRTGASVALRPTGVCLRWRRLRERAVAGASVLALAAASLAGSRMASGAAGDAARASQSVPVGAIVAPAVTSTGTVSPVSAPAAAPGTPAGGVAASAPARHLSLPQAVRLALAGNKGLIVARLRQESEWEGLELARSDFDLKLIPVARLGRLGDSALAPGYAGQNASLGARLERRFETGTTLSVGPSWNRSGNVSNTTLNVSLQQALLRGFDREATLNGERLAEYAVRTAQRDFDQTALNLALETIGAFYETLHQAQLQELTHALVERLQRQSLVARSKEGAGVASAMDSYRAEIALKDAQDADNQARSGLAGVRNRLKLLIDVDLDTPLVLDPPVMPVLATSDFESEALAHRGELLQLRAEFEEAQRLAHLAEGELLPEVTLQLSYGQSVSNDPVLNQYLPSTQRQWSVALQASTDLGRNAQKVAFRRAQLRVEALGIGLAAKEGEVRRQVRQQLAWLDEARARIGLRHEQIEQAASKLALAQVRFEHDMADNFTVLEAEVEAQRARANLAATESDYAIGIHNLNALTGHLLDGMPGADSGRQVLP